MTRRGFLAGAAAVSAAPQAGPRFTKSICSIIFPDNMPLPERFRRTKEAGFEGIEIPLGDTIAMDTPHDELERLRDEARKARIAIACLWVSQPISGNPLNSPDPALRAKGVAALEEAASIASVLECGALLVVPGRLGSGARFQVGYQDTWDRVTAEMKKALPAAERAKVVLAIENVWNKFLVSPLEMRAFVDQFHNPWLRTQFDVGNVMQFGYPEDWILTLGPRIVRVHLKDYKLSSRAEQGRFVDLLQGDVNWKSVMAVLVKVGYRGFLSPEISYDANDPAQLRKVSEATDTILALA
jgi:hexulose-6-phosphate isomerase